MHPRWFLSVLIITIGWRPDVSQADSVDDYIRQQMAERRIPGVALTIIQAGERVKTGCYGFADLEHRVPVTEDTVFEIGSVTKQLTAAGVLLLQQEGKLSLEDKLTKHFVDLPASWTNITVRHLLTHTSGIRSYTGLSGFELTSRLTQKQFLAAFRDRPLNFAPGTSWNYSNTGYSLLGYLIENVSGQNYWDYLRAKLFGPLQMNSTTNREPTRIIPHRAHGYERTNGVWINRDYDLTDVFAAGAVVPRLATWQNGTPRWTATTCSMRTPKSPCGLRPPSLRDNRPNTAWAGTLIQWTCARTSATAARHPAFPPACNVSRRNNWP